MQRMVEGTSSGANRRPGARTPSGKGAGSTLIFESVTSKFKRQLTDLMMRINAAHPHFVRCINPNSKKEANKLEPEMILDQLRCSGISLSHTLSLTHTLAISFSFSLARARFLSLSLSSGARPRPIHGTTVGHKLIHVN